MTKKIDIFINFLKISLIGGFLLKIDKNSDRFTEKFKVLFNNI